MIKSFRNRTLSRFFETGDPRRLSVQNIARLSRALRALDDAERPEDMDLPGFRLHPLKGAAKGRYAVDASGIWRMTFAFDKSNAVDVDLEDYL